MKRAVRNELNGVQDHRASTAARPGIFHTGMHILTAALLVLLCVATLLRNDVWDTKLSLWHDVARKSPLKSRAHNNLGNCYALLGRLFDAIEQYKIAVALDKTNIEAYYNLGMYLENVGILSEAVYYYDVFCKAAPPDYAGQKMRSCERVETLSR